MLREIERVKQNSGEPRRRWFTDDRMDLFVWTDARGIAGFQLSYDKNGQEKALTWRRERGYRHDLVDDGARPGGHPRSPILISGGPFDMQRVVCEFRRGALDIDKTIGDFVATMLLDARSEPASRPQRGAAVEEATRRIGPKLFVSLFWIWLLWWLLIS